MSSAFYTGCEPSLAALHSFFYPFDYLNAEGLLRFIGSTIKHSNY